MYFRVVYIDNLNAIDFNDASSKKIYFQVSKIKFQRNVVSAGLKITRNKSTNKLNRTKEYLIS